jgi:hypothetical protein
LQRLICHLLQAFLSYHLTCSNYQNHCPVTWSPSFQSVGELIFTLLPFDTLSQWPLLKDNFTHRITHVHLHLKILNLIQTKFDSDSPPFQANLESYKSFLNHISSTKDITEEFVKNNLKIPFCANMVSEKNIWIIKPIGLSCGENIQLGTGIENVLQIAKTFEFKCIVQKYIENPLLVRDHRKFDIRQWVLISSLDPLIIYGFSEGYLRLNSKEFSLEEKSLNDPLMHLCNHAIQQKKDGREEKEEEVEEEGKKKVEDSLNYDTMMTQNQFIQELSRRFSTSTSTAGEITINRFHSILLPKIKEISIDVVNSVKDRLMKVADGFEWLGLDLMVTDDLQVYLLEVNTSPDISHSTPITSRLLHSGVPDLFSLLRERKENPSARIDFTDGFHCSVCHNSSSSTGNTEESPHWCVWCYDDKPANNLQVSSMKRKTFKLQNKCIPSDTRDIEGLLSVFTSKGNGVVEDNDDDDEI